MMDTSYCLKCRKQTKNLNSKGFVTKNKKYLVKSLCDICKSKKTKFFFKIWFSFESGFLSNLFPKIPILNKII